MRGDLFAKWIRNTIHNFFLCRRALCMGAACHPHRCTAHQHQDKHNTRRLRIFKLIKTKHTSEPMPGHAFFQCDRNGCAKRFSSSLGNRSILLLLECTERSWRNCVKLIGLDRHWVPPPSVSPSRHLEVIICGRSVLLAWPQLSTLLSSTIGPLESKV